MRTVVLPLLAAAGLAARASRPATVDRATDSSFTSVRAGDTNSIGFASYLVDAGTQTCWFAIGWGVGFEVSPLDCCALRRVPAAVEHVPWATDATCADHPGAAAPPQLSSGSEGSL